MKLSVSLRETFKKKNKLLRKEWLVPGVIYGKHVDTPSSITIPRIDFLKVFSKTWKSTPIEVSGDWLDFLVLVHDIQLDPVTDHVVHVDLLAVNKDEKVRAEVPIILEGVSPFEKNGLGRVQSLKSTIVVEALPLDLPHDIKVDISSLDHDGQAIFLKDLNISDKVEIMDDLDLPVVTTVEFSEEPAEDEVAMDWEAEAGEEAAAE